MSEVCHNVGIEPLLQPLSGESLEYRSANREDGARLDVMSQGFWAGDRQCAFFDVRVFNPFAHSNRNHSLTVCYRRHEQEKRRSYDQHVRDVEHGSFSPLVFFNCWWHGSDCQGRVQEAGINACCQAQPTLQSHSELAPV